MYSLIRVFSSSAQIAKVPRLPPRMKIPESDIEESFVKGTGPGGQKINKTNSAVQLKHIPSGIVVNCQHTRSRSQNREIARRRLADKLDEIENGDQSRKALRAADRAKKKAYKAKKAARKYRQLEPLKVKRNEEFTASKAALETAVASKDPGSEGHTE